jgi:hypothetical protein
LFFTLLGAPILFLCFAASLVAAPSPAKFIFAVVLLIAMIGRTVFVRQLKKTSA